MKIMKNKKLKKIDRIAWYIKNSGKITHTVGEKLPNAWGLHDMLGNVWEWCLDRYKDHLHGGCAVDPLGPETGMARVLRGGSWISNGRRCRSAYRYYWRNLDARINSFGFRVVLTGDEPVDPSNLYSMGIQIENEILKLIKIEPGTFLMGSPVYEKWVCDREVPQMEVTLTKEYWMGKYPVTQGQYEALMGVNPSYFKGVGKDAPVERVSWNDAVDFCKKLTEREKEAGLLDEGYEYRLPTEAEWEYACRAGSKGKRYKI